jgi:hypothetical protein
LCAFSIAASLVLIETAFRRLSTAAFVLASLWAGAMPFVHGRFTLVPICWLVCAIVVLARSSPLSRRRRLETIALSVLATAVAYLLLARVNAAVVDRLWTDPPSQGSPLREAMLEPAFWVQAVKIGLGQAWYLLAASLGCAALGLILLAGLLRGSPPAQSAHRATSATAMALLGVTFATSVATIASGIYRPVAMGRPVRGDYFIHGRYIECIVVVLAGLGVGSMLSERPRRALRREGLLVGVSMAVLAFAVWASIPDKRNATFDPAIAGVAYFPWTSEEFDIMRWTLVALVGTAVLFVASRLPSAWPVVILIALFGVGALWASDGASYEHERWLMQPLHADVPLPSADHDAVVVASDIARAGAYRLASLVQEYTLATRGWRFEFTPYSSGELHALDPPQAGVLVLVKEQPVNGSEWRLAGELGPTRVWVRRALDATDP